MRLPMKLEDRAPVQFPSAVSVRFKGYGRSPRRPSSPWLRLGAVIFIVLTAAITLVFRHRSQGLGESPPVAAAPEKLGAALSQPKVSQPKPASASSIPVSTARSTVAPVVIATPAAPVATPALAPARRPGNPPESQTPSATTRSVTKPAMSTPALDPSPGLPAGANVGAHPSAVQGGGGHRYHVQVGALSNKAAAEELAGRLRGLGYAVRIAGAQPFLVWVGGYLDEATASRLVAQLRVQGFDAILKAGGPQQP